MPEKLTEARVKALAFDGKPAVVRDAKVTGLLVAVNKTGKSYKVQRDLWQGPRGRAREGSMKIWQYFCVFQLGTGKFAKST